MATQIINSQKRVFSDSFRMETETEFREDGSISTYPLSYELGQRITCNGSEVKMKAKVVVDPDGNTHVKPYRHNSGQRYRQLMTTTHGEVKETATDLIVKLQFHKAEGRHDICDMLEDEMDDINLFLETTNKISQWQ